MYINTVSTDAVHAYLETFTLKTFLYTFFLQKIHYFLVLKQVEVIYFDVTNFKLPRETFVDPLPTSVLQRSRSPNRSVSTLILPTPCLVNSIFKEPDCYFAWLVTLMLLLLARGELGTPFAVVELHGDELAKVNVLVVDLFHVEAGIHIGWDCADLGIRETGEMPTVKHIIQKVEGWMAYFCPMHECFPAEKGK